MLSYLYPDNYSNMLVHMLQVLIIFVYLYLVMLTMYYNNLLAQPSMRICGDLKEIVLGSNINMEGSTKFKTLRPLTLAVLRWHVQLEIKLCHILEL